MELRSSGKGHLSRNRQISIELRRDIPTVDENVTRNAVEETDRRDEGLAGLDANNFTSSEPSRLSELKPADGGRDAWQLLIAAFIFEALFWGFPTSYGVFQAYYSTQSQFSSSPSSPTTTNNNNTSQIAVIGTLAQGLAYLGAPFSAALTKKFPRHQRFQLLFGWTLCITGLLAASFADSIASLILTQGMTYGLGFIILTYPILNMINEWWIVRKGMAFGSISAASGLTGIFMPLVLEALLGKYGYKITLRACAVAMVVLTAPLIPLLRGRVPLMSTSSPAPAASFTTNVELVSVSQEQMEREQLSESRIVTRERQRERPVSRASSISFLRKPRFYAYALAMMTQGFGFFIPPIFISSYAISLGLSSTKAASLLAMMSLSQTLGQFVFGWLSDLSYHHHNQTKFRFPVSLLASTCCVVSGVATLTLWGLGKSFALLMLYSLIYGFFAFAFSTLRVAMGRAVTSDQSAVLVTYSTFVFLQGIGNVLVGPVVAGLMSSSTSTSSGPSSLSSVATGFDSHEYGAANYKSIIIFVASSSFLGAVFMVVPALVKNIAVLLR